MGQCRYLHVLFVPNSNPNVVNVLQDVNERPVAGEISRWNRRFTSTGAMLDRLPLTFMGQQMGTETREYSFFVPGFGSIAFFILQKFGSPPANIYTKAWVLSRPETCSIDDAVNWQSIGIGQNTFVYIPPQPFTALALSTPICFCLSTDVYVSKGTWATTAYLR